jgi:hypothetical protein
MKKLFALGACALVAAASGCAEDEGDGTATVEAGIDPARDRFELEGGELEQLRAELEAADFVSYEPSDEPTGCADCFAYEVTYDGTTISYDESESVPAPITTVVAHLSEITADNYPPGAFEPPIVN